MYDANVVKSSGFTPAPLVNAGPSIPVPTIGIPVSKPTQDSKHAADKAMAARGAAIATNLIKECERQSGSLKRFLKDIAELDQKGRTAFRVAIKQSLDATRAMLKGMEGQPEYEVLAKAARSASVRTSEAVTFSKAIDAGFSPDMETETYPMLVGASREYLNGAAAGPTQKRGRKAIPTLDKIKAYIQKVAKPGEMEGIATMVATMAQVAAAK